MRFLSRVASVASPVVSVAPVIAPHVVVHPAPVNPVIIPPVPIGVAPIPALPFSAVRPYPNMLQPEPAFTAPGYGTVIYPGYGSYMYGTNITYFPPLMLPM